MTQSRGSVDGEEEREEGQGLYRREPSTCSKLDDSTDLRKSQAQRLLEFEMWTNDNTLKDLEYSQRRSEKKQRERERRKHYQKRCWKKLYLPAVLCIVFGTFFTLCATLESLAGDSFLWNARGFLIFLGPILTAAGLLALMLAAGCTFKHDQEAREKPIAPPSEFLLPGFVFHDRRPSSVVRSNSVVTADLPLPLDLDPSRTEVGSRSGWSRSGKMGRNRSVSWDDSVHDVSPLMPGNSYSSTATWVQSVSAAHSQIKADIEPRQNSDTRLASSAAHFQHLQEVSLPLGDTDQDHSGSQSDLHVACTRSVTSSGYHSASDSASGTVEYPVPCESSRKNSSYAPHRHNAPPSANQLPAKNSTVRDSKLAGCRTLRGSYDTVVESVSPNMGRKLQQSISQKTPLFHINPVSLTFTRPHAFPQGANHSYRNPPRSEKTPFTPSAIVGSISPKVTAHPSSSYVHTHGQTGGQGTKASDHMLTCATRPSHGEPRVMYRVCGVLTTDL